MVSCIGLGTTKFGRNTDVKYPAAFELPSDRELEELLAVALDLGINLLDTAPAYGESEERLGRLIASARQRWILCTKCGESYSDGRSRHNFSRAALTRSVDFSLKRLQTDYVDILLLHSDGNDLEILNRSDAVETMKLMKARGQARAIGISAKTPAGIAAASTLFDVIMAPFSEDHRTLEPALAQAHRKAPGILAIKGLSSGHLAAAPAIRFVLRQPFIDALIVGTINKAHLQEVAAAASAVVLRGGGSA
jgi:aryl-alcohol dehydrogenase-like predicted oxidoreductase